MERADLEQWKAREVARLLRLVETERRYYQEIAASIPVGLLVVSPDLTIVSANRAIRKIFGLAKSPLRSPLHTLFPAGLIDRVMEVLRVGQPQTNILVLAPQPLRVGILAITSWDDESSQEIMICVEDLTGAEASGVLVPGTATAVAPESPERRLLEDQLVQSERMQAMTKLAARLAHDLNNMLMIVTGHAEELMNNLPPESTLRADVQEVINASERMSGVTGYLLSFVRREPAGSGSVDLAAVLGAMKQRPGLEIKLQSVVVKANAERLEQFVAALAEREKQIAIETSRVEIKTDLKRPDAPLKRGVYGIVDITMRSRAFEAGSSTAWFESVLPAKGATDDWATTVTRAYAAVRQWGGDIVASPAAGGGTLLRVFLESVPGTGEEPTVGAAGEARLGTILVAEDEPGIRALMQKILSRHGYQVLEAANGEEALRLFVEKSADIDLLITDVIMPRMTGAELVDRLRKQGLNPKVLFVSGYTDDPSINAGKFPAGTAFLAKPFTLAALVDKVREVLGW